MASFALAPCSAKLACRASLRTRNVAQRLPARAARRAQLAAPRSAISLPPPTADEQSPAQWCVARGGREPRGCTVPEIDELTTPRAACRLQATLQALLAPAAAVEESAARCAPAAQAARCVAPVVAPRLTTPLHRPASDAPAEEDAAAPAEEPEFDDALIW
jgi:hypothetical protein